MPRPHSPDCLLWAKHLKDEYNKLKARTAHLEKTVSDNDATITSLRSSGTSLQGLASELGILTDRIRNVEDQGQKYKCTAETSISDVETRIAQLQKTIETQVNKVTSLERSTVEMREEHEDIHRTQDALMLRIEATERITAEGSRTSPKVTRKNDLTSMDTLGPMIDSLLSRQDSDHDVIQRLQTQLQHLLSLLQSPTQRSLAAVLNESPCVQADLTHNEDFDSSLERARSHVEETYPPVDCQNTDPAAGMVHELQTPMWSEKARAPGESHAKREFSTTARHAAKPSKKCRKPRQKPQAGGQTRHGGSAPSQSTRVTRSQARVMNIALQTGSPTKHTIDSEGVAIAAGVGSQASNQQMPANDQFINGKSAAIIIARTTRRRRSISTLSELPALEDMSD